MDLLFRVKPARALFRLVLQSCSLLRVGFDSEQVQLLQTHGGSCHIHEIATSHRYERKKCLFRAMGDFACVLICLRRVEEMEVPLGHTLTGLGAGASFALFGAIRG